MRPIRYGILTKSGKKIINPDLSKDEWYVMYVLQTPKQVLDNKVGVCWDQVELERDYCKKNEIPHATYIFTSDIPDDGNHTFLVFKTEDNKLYWFENSWREYRGIHGPYLSTKDVFKTIGKKLSKHPNKYFYKYGTPQYGCGGEEYLNYVTRHLVYKEGGD